MSRTNGIGGRYLSEGRLLGEITRSAAKYNGAALPLIGGWAAPEAEKVPAPAKMPEPPPAPIPEPADQAVS
jgi:hypothetical protein